MRLSFIPEPVAWRARRRAFGGINMKALCLFVALASTGIHIACEAQTLPQGDTNVVTFREPFTLKLHVDKEHYYEQEFPKIPYVHQGEVYLFKGDSFGIDINITNGVVRGISYQAGTNKAAVSLRFTQEVKDDGNSMMLLVIENHTKHKLFVDALMTVPKRERPQKTSILPLEPGLAGYESWPHPIIQLVLRNVRLIDKAGTEQKPDGSANRSQPFGSETNRAPSPAGSRR